MPIDVDETRFGSDKTGLLCAYRFQPHQCGEAIDADQAALLLQDDVSGISEPFLWLHRTRQPGSRSRPARHAHERTGALEEAAARPAAPDAGPASARPRTRAAGSAPVAPPPAQSIEMSEVEDLRDAAEQLSSAVADCATLVGVRLLQEELLVIVNERTNHMLFLLTVLTALVAPMTVVSSSSG